MKSISFFLLSLNFGGIEANTIRLANSFCKSGYKVDLVVGHSGGDYQKRVDNGINIVNLKKKSLIKMALPLLRYLRKNKPKVIITGGEGANILLGIMKKLMPSQKVIISIRTNLSTEYRESNNRKKKLLFPFFSKVLYKNVDKIVTVSKGVANDASEFLGYPLEKFNVIYNPIVDEGLLELMNEEVEHEWLDNDNYKVLLSVGRLVKQKDLVTLIKGFKLAKQKDNSLKLIIIGEGPEKSKLVSMVKEYNLEKDIVFQGFVQNPYPFMKKADIFILSSQWEGFGNVLVEALATGVPIISTDCPSGPSEILDHGKYGKMIQVGDYNHLSEEIVAIINQNNHELQFLRKKRAEEFTVQIAKEKYIYLINSN